MRGIDNVGSWNFNDILVQSGGVSEVVCQEVGGFVGVLRITIKEFVHFASGGGCARTGRFLSQSANVKAKPLY